MSIVDIRVDLPSYSQSFIIKVPPSSSVSQLKEQIHQTCPGQPRPDGQRLIWRGRVLKDSESIDSLWKTEPRIVHLAVHPSAWSSPPPEIPQSPSQFESHFEPNPLNSSSLTSPPFMYSPRPTFSSTQPGIAAYLTQTALRPSMEYIRYLHQKSLHILCQSIPAPMEHFGGPLHRNSAVHAVQQSGWTWPAVLDEPFPDITGGGLVYDAAIIGGQPYLQLVTGSEDVIPTPAQQHALKVLTYTFNIIPFHINGTPVSGGILASQTPAPIVPHINQLVQQLGLPPMRVAGNAGNPANQNHPLLAEIREIPVRALLAPLMMLLFRTVLLLYFFAPARKPIFGILILGWMLYEIWQPIRNGLRNGWGRMQENGQRQVNIGPNQRQPPGPVLPNGHLPPDLRAARPVPAGAVTLEAQAAQFIDTLANLNIDDEQQMLNLNNGVPAAEPTIGHKIITFASLFLTTLHPAVWNRRRVALRRREGVVRTEANIRNTPPPAADNESESAPPSESSEAAQRREQLRAQYGRYPRWIQHYMDRVVAEDWVDDSD